MERMKVIPEHSWRAICLPQEEKGEDRRPPAHPLLRSLQGRWGVGGVPLAEADTFVGFLSLSNPDLLMSIKKKSHALS